MAKTSVVTDPGGRFNSKVFSERVGQLDQKKASIGTLRGEISQVWKYVEEHGGNKRAMRDAMKIRDMPDNTRNDYLAYLQVYCEWLNVFAQIDMFGQPGIPKASAAAVSPELPMSEEEIEASMAPVLSVAEIDACEAEGYDAASQGRSPGFAPYQMGTIERVAFDRGYANRMAESATIEPDMLSDEPPAKRGRGRPRVSRVPRGQRLAPGRRSATHAAAE